MKGGIIYKEIKKISGKQLFELYKSVGWIKEDCIDDNGELVDMHKNAVNVFSAWDNKKLVGVVRVLTDKTENGVLFGLVVRKEYQNKGIGTKLIKRCMKEYPKIEWFISTMNPKAKNLYTKLGFKKTKEEWFSKKEKWRK